MAGIRNKPGRAQRFRDEGWPFDCKGGCGRQVRPPHTPAAEFPNTVMAARNDGVCVMCDKYTRLDLRAPSAAPGSRNAAAEQESIDRARAWLDKYAADRRARGISPEGVVFEGEDAQHIERQRPLPESNQPQSLGVCSKGHPFTRRLNNGQRWCDECHKIKIAAATAKRQAKAAAKMSREPSPEAPLGRCRKLHPYTSVIGKKEPRLYCPKCKKRRATRNRRKQQQQEQYRRAA